MTSKIACCMKRTKMTISVRKYSSKMKAVSTLKIELH